MHAHQIYASDLSWPEITFEVVLMMVDTDVRRIGLQPVGTRPGIRQFEDDVMIKVTVTALAAIGALAWATGPGEIYTASVESTLNFQGADLSGQDYRGEQLAGLDMSRARLSAANLDGANLTGALLTGANLTGASLRRASLNDIEAPFSYLSMAVMQDTQAANADFRGAIMTGANLRSAVLIGADLSGIVLSMADLSAADLRNADLGEEPLYDGGMSKAKKSQANPALAALIAETLPSMRRNGGPMRGADLRGADLTGARLDNANIGGADLRRTQSLTQAQVDSACQAKGASSPRLPRPLTWHGRSCGD